MSADLLERPAPLVDLPAAMRAVSLWQPWASLVADGRKRIETRSWAPAHRGRIAIHAARSIPRLDEAPYAWGAYPLEVYEATRSTEAPGRFPPSGQVAEALPLGAVVATCTLAGVVRTEDVRFDGTPGSDWIALVSPGRMTVHSQSGNEPLGDFAPGRFAWLLEDVEPLPEPIPAKGRQGLWWWRP